MIDGYHAQTSTVLLDETASALRSQQEMSQLLAAFERLSAAQLGAEVQHELPKILDRKQQLLDALAQLGIGQKINSYAYLIERLLGAHQRQLAHALIEGQEGIRAHLLAIAATEKKTENLMQVRVGALRHQLANTNQRHQVMQTYQESDPANGNHRFLNRLR